MAEFPNNPHVRICPYCENNAQFILQAQANINARIEPHNPDSSEDSTYGGIFACVVCKGMLFIRLWNKSGNLEMFPYSVPHVSSDIPSPVKEIYEEALRCHSIEAWNATAVMCRRAIQEAVLDLGGKGKELFSQIKDLDEKRIITPALVEYAHEVRLIGKDGAHADVPTDVSPEDANEAINFTTEFLNYVYVLQERLKSRKARKDAEKTETSDS